MRIDVHPNDIRVGFPVPKSPPRTASSGSQNITLSKRRTNGCWRRYTSGSRGRSPKPGRSRSTTGTLNPNWRLLVTPPDVATCLIIRELSHLLERNHTEAFRSVVSEHDPDYREHDKWLEEHGTRLLSSGEDTQSKPSDCQRVRRCFLGTDEVVVRLPGVHEVDRLFDHVGFLELF